MPFDFSKINMSVPPWVQEIRDSFDVQAQPYNEVEVSDALRSAKRNHPEMSPEDFKGFYSEWAAFLFLERNKTWGTYFGPMMTYGDTASPDLRELDAEIISHWEKRSASAKSPVMQARYADLVWDFKQRVTSERPSHEYALLAISAYEEASNKSRYSMPMQGVSWLRRAFELSLSLGGKERAREMIVSVFRFYDASPTPRGVGVWLFPFDLLRQHFDLLTEAQQTRLILDLEEMLDATSTLGRPEFDPHAAQAAAERLAEQYRRKADKAVLSLPDDALEPLLPHGS